MCREQKNTETSTLTEEKDSALEELWEEFGDIPMNPETEKIEAPFMDFPAGTDREDIWHWFDERHSKGVAYLLYYIDSASATEGESEDE